MCCSLALVDLFQTVQLVLDRNSLNDVISGQAKKMEQSISSSRAPIHWDPHRPLAQGGNANATLIVEELRKRGITINPTRLPQLPRHKVR